jgi:hypothetical protein
LMRSYGMTYLSLTFNFAFSADEKRGSELPRGRTSRSSSAGCDAPLPPPCDHRSARCSRVPSEAEVVGPPARTAGGSSAATIRCGGFADDAPHPILLDRVERSAPCPPVPSRFRGALALLLRVVPPDEQLITTFPKYDEVRYWKLVVCRFFPFFISFATII